MGRKEELFFLPFIFTFAVCVLHILWFGRAHVCISAILVITGRNAFHIGNVYYVNVLFCDETQGKNCNISSFAATDDIRWKCRQMNLAHSLCIFQLFHRAVCRHLCTLEMGPFLCVGLSGVFVCRPSPAFGKALQSQLFSSANAIKISFEFLSLFIA